MTSGARHRTDRTRVTPRMRRGLSIAVTASLVALVGTAADATTTAAGSGGPAFSKTETLTRSNLLADGSCGNSRQLTPRPVLVYAGSRPDPRHPRRIGETVVYGMVSPAVRALRLGLSDCSTALLSLDVRPLFLVFVEHAKLRRGASPTSVTATLSSGRTVRHSLAPRDACRRP